MINIAKKIYPYIKKLFLLWSIFCGLILLIISVPSLIKPFYELAETKVGFDHYITLYTPSAIILTVIIWAIYLVYLVLKIGDSND